MVRGITLVMECVLGNDYFEIHLTGDHDEEIARTSDLIIAPDYRLSSKLMQPG